MRPKGTSQIVDSKVYTLLKICIEISAIPPLTALSPQRFERPDILKRINAASRELPN